MEQEQFVGFDVSQAETSVCVVDGAGKVVWQGKCASTPEAMADPPWVFVALPRFAWKRKACLNRTTY